MEKTMIERMREEQPEFFEKYPDAILAEWYEYCLPVQDCYIPAFVEFPVKVTFKDGSVKYFETTFGGMTNHEIEYKDYQLKFLMPYNGSRGGERLSKKIAVEWLDRAIEIFSYEQDGEAYDTLHFLKSRKDEIGALSHLFLGILNLYLSVTAPSYYKEWEDSKEKEVYASIGYDEFRLALHTALNGGDKALKALFLIGKFGKIVELREKGQRVAVETVRGLFSDAVKLWKRLRVESITLFSGKMQERERFTAFVEKAYPDFQKSASIYSEEYFRSAPYNLENLSMHERVEASLEAFLDRRIYENKSEPIVIYDAFFYLDEGKDLSEIFTKMRDTKRPVFVFLPENVECKIEFIDEPVDDERMDMNEEISEFKDKGELAKAIPYVAFKRWGEFYMEHLSKQGKARVYEAWKKIKLVDLQSLSNACLKVIPKCWFYDWLHVHYMGMPTPEAESFLKDVMKRFPEKNNPYVFRRGQGQSK